MSQRDARATTTMDAAIGTAIRNARTACGLTQAQMAKAMGITPQQIQKYETATNRIAAVRLFDVARALDITTDDLLQAATKIAESPATKRIGGDRRRLDIARDIARLPLQTQDAVAHLVRSLLPQQDSRHE